MKKLLLIVFAIVGAVYVTTQTSCADGESNPCEDKTPPITAKFILSIQVKFQDGTPWPGTVYFHIYKKYCGGAISGSYTTDGPTIGETGIYHTGHIYTYELQQKDEVYIQFEVHGQKYVYVDQKFTGFGLTGPVDKIEKQYSMILPWDPPIEP